MASAEPPLGLFLEAAQWLPISPGAPCEEPAPASLVVRPGAHCIAKRVFHLHTPGLLRVLSPDGGLFHHLAFSPEGDVLRLVAGISALALHGLRDDVLTSNQLERLARRQQLSLTCHHLSRFANWLLRSLDVRSRIAQVFALPRAQSSISEHVMIEVFVARNASRSASRWVVIDLDNKALVRDPASGGLLDAMALLLRSRRPLSYAIEPLAPNSVATVSVVLAQPPEYRPAPASSRQVRAAEIANMTDVVTRKRLGVDEFYLRLYRTKGKPEGWEPTLDMVRQWHQDSDTEDAVSLDADFAARYAVGSIQWTRRLRRTYMRSFGALTLVRNARTPPSSRVFLTAPWRHGHRVFTSHRPWPTRTESAAHVTDHALVSIARQSGATYVALSDFAMLHYTNLTTDQAAGSTSEDGRLRRLGLAEHELA